MVHMTGAVFIRLNNAQVQLVYGLFNTCHFSYVLYFIFIFVDPLCKDNKAWYKRVMTRV